MNANKRDKIREINNQHLHERLKGLTSTGDLDLNPINDIIGSQSDKKDDVEIYTDVAEEPQDLSSLQDRFGVRKVNKPVKDAQLTARIDSGTLTRFKDIVRKMYYPDKPNINETVTQIIRAFVDEYDKNNK